MLVKEVRHGFGERLGQVAGVEAHGSAMKLAQGVEASGSAHSTVALHRHRDMLPGGKE